MGNDIEISETLLVCFVLPLFQITPHKDNHFIFKVIERLLELFFQ